MEVGAGRGDERRGDEIVRNTLTPGPVRPDRPAGLGG